MHFTLKNYVYSFSRYEYIVNEKHTNKELLLISNNIALFGCFGCFIKSIRDSKAVLSLWKQCGDRETRTLTVSLPLAPEASVSTNSTISPKLLTYKHVSHHHGGKTSSVIVFTIANTITIKTRSTLAEYSTPLFKSQ